jgi:DNA-directed RNA polymerase subunit RPC12/RpoP
MNCPKCGTKVIAENQPEDVNEILWLKCPKCGWKN